MKPRSLPTFSDIDNCMLLQRHRLRQQLGGLQQRERQGKPNDQGMSRLWEQIQRSQMQAAQRKQALPVPQFPSELPISEKRD